jgi:hypothetical protein
MLFNRRLGVFLLFRTNLLFFHKNLNFKEFSKFFSVFEISILKDKISQVDAKVCLHWRSGVGQNATFHDSCKKQQIYSVTTTSRIDPNVCREIGWLLSFVYTFGRVACQCC